jgi:two-component system, chemotaxis family, response regulator Rcp1
MTSVDQVQILLVEDNPADVRLTREAFRECKIQAVLSVVKDGVEAISCLRRQGRYSDAPRPDLILLDLNLPRKNGREVLAEIKSDQDFKRIPVVILTTSSSETDIVASYNLHANAYVVKPTDMEKFGQVLQGIDRFWFSVAHLSPR